MSKKHPGGRPLKYTPEQIDRLIDEYIDSCWQQKFDDKGNALYDSNGKAVMEQVKPYTMTGFAVFADTSRETLNEYMHKPEFVDAIKRIKDICYQFTENYLYSGKNPAGAIFSLKNNYQWTDKQELDINAKVVVFSGDDSLLDE